MSEWDEDTTPKLCYEDHGAPPSDAEHVRQAFSNIAYIRDHLDCYFPEVPWTPQEQEQIEAALDLLRQAHKTLKALALGRTEAKGR